MCALHSPARRLFAAAAMVSMVFSMGTSAVMADDDSQAAVAGIDSTWLPTDAEIVVHLGWSDIWQSNLFDEIRDSAEVADINSKLEEVGFGIEDIESITLGISGVDLGAFQGLNPQQAQQQGQQAAMEANFSVVIRFGVAVDLAEMMSLAQSGDLNGTTITEGDYDGMPYYTINPADAPSSAAFSPDEYTIVLVKEELLESVMEAEGACENEEAISQFSAGELVVIFTPNDSEVMNDLFAAMNPAGGDVKADEVCSGIGISLDWGSKATLKAEFLCNSEELAAEFATGMSQGFKGAIQQQALNGLPPAARTMINSFRTGNDAELAYGSMMIPQELIDEFAQGFREGFMQELRQ